jgi:hypothetical protein
MPDTRTDRFGHADYRDFTGMARRSAQDGREEDYAYAPPDLPRLTSLAACLAVLAPALALGACDNGGVRITTTRSDTDAKGVLKVVDALQCPDSLGSLTRKGSARADGAVCTYTGPRGAEVELHLVSLGDDGADPILKRFEAGLLAVMPQTAADISRSAADAARADADAARADADSARAEADSARAEADARANGADSAHITAPGMKVDAEGDRASVHMPASMSRPMATRPTSASAASPSTPMTATPRSTAI